MLDSGSNNTVTLKEQELTRDAAHSILQVSIASIPFYRLLLLTAFLYDIKFIEMFRANFLTASILKYFRLPKPEEFWKAKEDFKYKGTDWHGSTRYLRVLKNLKMVLRKSLITH